MQNRSARLSIHVLLTVVSTCLVGAYYSDKDVVTFGSLLWVDDETTKELRRDSGRIPKLIPLDQFFNEPPPDALTDPKNFALWQSQARLFVHWALIAKKTPEFPASAFWQFANDSRLSNVTEDGFRSYFGRDYATALAELQAYLPQAVRNIVDRTMPGLHESAAIVGFEYRAATESEVARIKGNFERMEAQRLKQTDPGLSARYEQAAYRSLERAMSFVPVDPRIYGILGLLEFDTQHPGDARRHLETAYAANVLGSRALLALAKLRLEEGMTSEGGLNQLKTNALEGVLEPLYAARDRRPVLVETYRLIAESWSRCETSPTRGHLEVLREGVQLFPWDVELRDKTHELYRHFGYEEDSAP